MLPINYSLIGSVTALSQVALNYSSIELLFHCYETEKMRESATDVPDAIKNLIGGGDFSNERKAFYAQSVKQVAAHYYGFESDSVEDLIAAIKSHEYGQGE